MSLTALVFAGLTFGAGVVVGVCAAEHFDVSCADLYAGAKNTAHKLNPVLQSAMKKSRHAAQVVKEKAHEFNNNNGRTAARLG